MTGVTDIDGPSPATGTRVRLFVLVGLIGAVATVVAVAMTSAGWGQPGTAEYDRYEMGNRVAALAIIPLSAAPMALREALAGRRLPGGTAMLVVALAMLATAAGTAAEFTIFSGAPYQGAGSEGRLVAYLGSLVGALVTVAAMALAGASLLRRADAPRWAGPATTLAAVAGLIVALLGQSLFAGLAVVGAAAALIALGLVVRPAQGPDRR